jgi:hypothetical protein
VREVVQDFMEKEEQVVEVAELVWVNEAMCVVAVYQVGMVVMSTSGIQEEAVATTEAVHRITTLEVVAHPTAHPA